MEKSKESSMNDVFLQKLTEAVYANLNNEQFGAEQLAKEVGISRSQIHRKLHKINGKSITQFIREIRLTEALRLLQQEVGTASEISYLVGFGSPTYFNKCFHEYFGYPPGEVKRKKEESPGMKASIEKDHEFLTKEMDKLSAPSKSEQLFNIPKASRKNKFPYYIIAGLVIIMSTMLIWYLLPKHTEIEIEKSIAVLPFINDSPDPENEYFCNGIMGDILNNLSKINDLHVISRRDVEPYRNSTKNRKEIAKELSVANLLEGSVRKEGNRFKIIVQLINAESGFHIWSDSYEGEYTEEIFAVQSEIAKQVASSLQALITPEEEERIEKAPTASITAYDLELKGRQMYDAYWRTFKTQYAQTAHEFYNMALKADPKYFSIYSAKVDMFLSEGKIDSASYYISKRMELDPEYRGFVELAKLNHSRGDFDSAIENYLKVVEIYPDNWFFNLQLGFTYIVYKNSALGLPYFLKGLKSISTESGDFNSTWIWVPYVHIGEYDLSQKNLWRMLESFVDCNTSWLYNNSLMGQGKFQEALHFTDSFYQINPCEGLGEYLKIQCYHCLGDFKMVNDLCQNSNIINLKNEVCCYEISAKWRLGYRDEATLLFNELLAKDDLFEFHFPYDYFKHYTIAGVCATLGENEKALQILNEYYHLVFYETSDLIMIDPLFENLRSDLEFLDIVKRVQDEKSALRDQLRELVESEGIELY